jgi:hypothetical protein
LDAMVLVKPATVIQWHRKGFRLYWRRRSRPLGRPQKSTQQVKGVAEVSVNGAEQPSIQQAGPRRAAVR